MYYSLLFNVTVLAVVLWLTRSTTAVADASINGSSNTGTSVPQQEPRTIPSPRTKRLAIEGLTHLPYEYSDFVSAYGVERKDIIDMGFYAQPGSVESFPPLVRACLEDCYSRGKAIGFEIMALLRKDGRLEDNQALYFALIFDGPDNMPFIKTFVDKKRTK